MNGNKRLQQHFTDEAMILKLLIFLDGINIKILNLVLHDIIKGQQQKEHILLRARSRQLSNCLW